MNEMKNIIILGSTGSIGRNTIEVALYHSERFRIKALAAGSNVEVLASQIKKINPEKAVIANNNKLASLKKLISLNSTQISSGEEEIINLTKQKDVDIVVIAISGSKALLPLVSAIEAGKEIALANKEALVMAGDIITKKAEDNNVDIRPIDSEHSAIFQCLQGNAASAVKRLYLTGSGGALDKIPMTELSNVTPEIALSHPKWQMGDKITIDSATLMNKGLEVIEAMHLFKMSADNIEILIHSEAIIHSLVEFVDGTVIAQLAPADMRLPIQYALSYPERLPSLGSRLDFSKVANLTFRKPNYKKFPLLNIAYEVAKKKGTYPCALNAANEELVKAFLDKKIKLTDIFSIVEKIIKEHKPISKPEISDILKTDASSRENTKEYIGRLK
jgi:1-deoxy-D-xylulose-5-phosphate reductoisomerase